jgi:hypothetical protein
MVGGRAAPSLAPETRQRKRVSHAARNWLAGFPRLSTNAKNQGPRVGGRCQTQDEKRPSNQSRSVVGKTSVAVSGKKIDRRPVERCYTRLAASQALADVERSERERERGGEGPPQLQTRIPSLEICKAYEGLPPVP